MAEISDCRRDFPRLHSLEGENPFIYLDTAATAQKPSSVIETMADFYRHHYATVHRAIYSAAVVATEQYQTARARLAEWLGAGEDEVIFTRGTTEGINLVASCFGRRFLGQGDEIVVTELEHHSNLVPWQIICQERGAVLRVVRVDERGVLDLEHYASLLSARTRMVAVAHISNAVGTIHPIEEMARLAHESGAVILVDGAQAVPHLRPQVKELDIDFYAFSGHKMYGPNGIGVLYGKRELLEELPPYHGGGDMIERVTLEHTTYAPPPMKFEAGTPAIAEVIGLQAALDYLERWGIERIACWEKRLLERATAALETIPGLRVIGTAPEKSAILTFAVDGVHALDVATLLDLEGCCIRSGHLCAQPAMRRFGLDAFARASFGMYNTLEEVDRFAEAVEAVVAKLR